MRGKNMTLNMDLRDANAYNVGHYLTQWNKPIEEEIFIETLKNNKKTICYSLITYYDVNAIIYCCYYNPVKKGTIIINNPSISLLRQTFENSNKRVKIHIREYIMKNTHMNKDDYCAPWIVSIILGDIS